MTDRQRLFLYGTLKRGGLNHALMAGQTYCGDARSAFGFRLIDLGEFPGLVSDPSDRTGVSGEVWSVDLVTLSRLDELEGVNEGLYRRERVQLQPPFDQADLDTYIYAGSTLGRATVPGGHWDVSRR